MRIAKAILLVRDVARSRRTTLRRVMRWKGWLPRAVCAPSRQRYCNHCSYPDISFLILACVPLSVDLEEAESPNCGRDHCGRVRHGVPGVPTQPREGMSRHM